MKVLHIEDNQEIIKSFSSLLKLQGHDYHYSLDGKKGLNLIKKNKFDLILLDLAMPVFSGFHVLGELSRYTHNTPIIVITAMELTANQKDEIRILEAASMLQKPVSFEELTEKINEFTPHAKIQISQ